MINRVIHFFILSLLFLSCSSRTTSEKFGAAWAVKEYPADHLLKAKKYAVVSQGEASSRAGVSMFEQGGNIVDAATAVTFSISVERPQSTGLGGGGFLLYKNAKEKIPLAYDFREMAPKNAYRDMYLDQSGNVIPNKSLDGIWAVGVPGLVAGILELHQKYGRLPLSKVLQPAIELAENGFRVYPELANALRDRAEVLSLYPASKAIFFKDEKPLGLGDLLQQKDLGKTLRLIAKEGKKAFYQGEIAKAIAAENTRLGGIMTIEDLKNYTVNKKTPLRGTYGGMSIYSMTPPSSGGAHVLQILNMVEGDHLKTFGPQHPHSMHLIAESMRLAFYDRARYLGDDQFEKVPIDAIISKRYAQELRQYVLLDRAKGLNETHNLDAFKYTPDHTTHFSIMDADGNAIVSTQTINGHFGSGVVVPGTGIVLNNEMDDFATKIGASNLFGALGGANNLIKPGKRPLSSMSPTIVMKQNEPVLVLGTPSGTRILTCVAQTILNYVEFNLPLPDAVALLRYHHQYSPNKIYMEPGTWDTRVKRNLVGMGHDVEDKDLGCRIQAISREGDVILGVSDPRGQGAAFGI